MEDNEILKSATTNKMKGFGGLAESFEANKRSRGVSADATKAKRNDNDWIPTEAVRAIIRIKE
jgi:hypothetical protein